MRAATVTSLVFLMSAAGTVFLVLASEFSLPAHVRQEMKMFATTSLASTPTANGEGTSSVAQPPEYDEGFFGASSDDTLSKASATKAEKSFRDLGTSIGDFAVANSDSVSHRLVRP